MEYMSILGLSPSLTAYGWAIVRLDGSVIDTGCVRTQPVKGKRHAYVDDDTRRVRAIARELVYRLGIWRQGCDALGDRRLTAI